MASTYSTRVRLEIQGDGENDDTWGDKANVNFNLIDEAMDGYLAKSCAGSSDVTLTSSNAVSDESRQRVLKFTGTLTGNISVIVPAVEKAYSVWNATSGAFSLTFKPSGGTGILIPQGFAGDVFTDGSVMYQTGVWVDPANGDEAMLVSVDAGASAGPDLRLYRNSASPADADLLAALRFDGNDDGGVQTTYAKVGGTAYDVTNATEDGGMIFSVTAAGASTNIATMSPSGLLVKSGAAAGDVSTNAFEVVETTDARAANFTSDAATVTSTIVAIRAARAANSAYNFFSCQADYDGTPNNVFRVGGDGNVYADGSYATSGAGFAEMFEWEDGNPAAEDRIGMTVALAGKKIRPATAGDAVIGVITGLPTMVGNAQPANWVGRFERDKFNRYKLTKNGERRERPGFDPKLPYVPRQERKEWACVSMQGQEVIRDDQPTDSRWVKLEQREDGVSLWLVR